MFVYSEKVPVILSQGTIDEPSIKESTDSYNLAWMGILRSLYVTETVWAIEYIARTGKHREPNKNLITFHLN